MYQVYGETSLTIEDPTPFTQVNVTIQTASQWSLNPEPVTSSFQSLPDRTCATLSLAVVVVVKLCV